MSDMILLAVGRGFAIGWFFVAVGVPCIVFGIYIRNHPEVLEGKKLKGEGRKQPKKGKNKKSKRQSKQAPKQDEKKESKGGGGSLIWGGLAMVLAGIASIAYDLAK